MGSGTGSTGVVENNLSNGRSFFESVSVRMEHRLSHGLSVIGDYMFSRLIEQDTWLNDTDPEPEKRISPFDHPNHFVLGATYALPIGKDRLVNLQSRWANAILGGWTVNGIYTAQTGAPLDLNNGQVNGHAFNTSVFDTKAADQSQFHIRTFSTTFLNLRSAGIDNLDASIMKQFQIRETMYFQLRMEAFNAVNHPVFGAPVTTISSTTFGQITPQGNLPRQIQLGARFVF